MTIGEISVHRPVLAAVLSLLIIVFGLAAFQALPLRELPNIDPPIVSISTDYRGASAEIVENRITQVIEDQIAGIEGVKTVSSVSSDGRSDVTIEFKLSRNIEDATNDVRNAVSRVIDDLPDEADPPQIAKVDADEQVILWFNLSATTMSSLDLSDFARRYLVDRLSVVDGVARVRIGGGQDYAIRIWLDRRALAARHLTVGDVENALRSENVELPGGRIESTTRNFSVRVRRGYQTPEDFASLVLARGDDGHLIRLGEVARVELGAANPYVDFRGNGEPQIGLGIVKQSTANTLAVAEAAKAAVAEIAASLPEGMQISINTDTSVFISAAIEQVYHALGEAMVLVVLVIFLFLGSIRAALIPALTVPVCILGAFILFSAFGITLNLITLLALILAIGLVVDDAIVVLENAQRRLDMGEPATIAAARGTRQVTFAILATTAVLIAVFTPIVFLEGNVGRLFSELAIAISSAVILSALVALTLSPMMCSILLRPRVSSGRIERVIEGALGRLTRFFDGVLSRALTAPAMAFIILGGTVAVCALLLTLLPEELAPPEDRGQFFVTVTAPEGQGFDKTVSDMRKVESIFLSLLEEGKVYRVLARVPGSFGRTEEQNTGRGVVTLAHWRDRDFSTADVITEFVKRARDIPGVRVGAFARQGFGGGNSQPVEFVIGGPSFDELAEWRDRILARASENPGLVSLDSDYEETKPQLVVAIDRARAADLGVSTDEIGRTLEAMLGSRQVTTYIDQGEEYDVVLQVELGDRRTPSDLTNLFVRSTRADALIPLSSVITLEERAAPRQLHRYNRLRAITISANLTPGYTLGEALAYLDRIASEELPQTAVIDYKGQSLELRESGSALVMTFLLALLVVFLVLAGQFESFVHPVVIMLCVPLAVAGALGGLYLAGSTLNLYSQIGIIVLIGIAAKNGILIVEFANQLRDSGRSIREAVHEATVVRFRPILMTNLATAMGAVPLVLSTGAGAASRVTIGTVIVSGVLVAMVLTLFVIPMLYMLFARFTRSPEAVSREMAAWEAANPGLRADGQAPAE